MASAPDAQSPTQLPEPTPTLVLHGMDSEEAECINVLTRIAQGTWGPCHASQLDETSSVTECLRVLSRIASDS
jgi:hypothetical protein